MKRCLVTGASGLIGSHLLQALTPEWEIHAIARRGVPGPASAGIVWHDVDVSRALDVHELPLHVDAVIYLAQSEHFRDFPERAMDIFEVNTFGLLRMLDYARRCGARTFIYGSSGGVYGPGTTNTSEDSPVLAEGDLGFYLGSKLCSEIVALNYSKLMNVTILRFFFVYGPGQRKTMLVPRLIDSVRTGKLITLQGKDGIRLNPTYVTDAAGAIIRALELEGTHKINIAGPEILSLFQICESIGRLLRCRPVYSVEAAPPRDIIGDITKMTDLLTAPKVGFQKGLQAVLQT
ncbi:hypothetical protein AYO43_02840 [Nitrospira sp. SCGC AG-212-E16]|nr:hypothetical protein AYO43_02840 [Nitrospira sp. SCGC AG-212-E16]